MNWIIFTIFGAFFQNLRSSLQKKLNKDLSLIASSYVRFVFALPFATIFISSFTIYIKAGFFVSINK